MATEKKNIENISSGPGPYPISSYDQEWGNSAQVMRLYDRVFAWIFSLETLGILFIPGHKKMFTFFQRHLHRAMSRYKVPGRASTHFMHRLFILTPFSHFYAAFVSELPRLLHPNYSSQFNCQHFCCKKAPSEGKIWNNQLSVKMTILFYKCFIPWQIVSFYNPIWFENSATYQFCNVA